MTERTFVQICGPNYWRKHLFNISLNAHTHKYAYHPKGELGNNYPVIIGGGYKMDGATVMILEKKKKTN